VPALKLSKFRAGSARVAQNHEEDALAKSTKYYWIPCIGWAPVLTIFMQPTYRYLSSQTTGTKFRGRGEFNFRRFGILIKLLHGLFFFRIVNTVEFLHTRYFIKH
jgi:hypothetical protein